MTDQPKPRARHRLTTAEVEAMKREHAAEIAALTREYGRYSLILIVAGLIELAVGILIGGWAF